MSSLAAHLLLLVLIAVLPTTSIQPLTLSGDRTAIWLQGAFAEAAEVAARVEFAPEESEPVSDTVVDEPNPRPSETEPLPLSERLALMDIGAPSPARTEARPTSIRRVDVLPDLESVPKATILPRRSTVIAVRTSMVATQLSAGLDAESPPDFTSNPPPVYPTIAVRNRWEGTVLLKLHVDHLGRIEHVEVETSSGYEILDQAAVTAVREWRGKPATRSGRTVATVEMLPIRFRL